MASVVKVAAIDPVLSCNLPATWLYHADASPGRCRHGLGADERECLTASAERIQLAVMLELLACALLLGEERNAAIDFDRRRARILRDILN